MFTLINFNQLPLAYTTLMSLIKTQQEQLNQKLNQKLLSSKKAGGFNFKKLKTTFEQNYFIVCPNTLTREQLNHLYLDLAPISTKPSYVGFEELKKILAQSFLYALQQNFIQLEEFIPVETSNQQIDTAQDLIPQSNETVYADIVKTILDFKYTFEKNQFIKQQLDHTKSAYTLDNYYKFAQDYPPKPQLVVTNNTQYDSIFAISDQQVKQAQVFLQQNLQNPNYKHLLGYDLSNCSNNKWIITQGFKEIEYNNNFNGQQSDYLKLIFPPRALDPNFVDTLFNPNIEPALQFNPKQIPVIEQLYLETNLKHKFTDNYIPQTMFFNAIKVQNVINDYQWHYPQLLNDLAQEQLPLHQVDHPTTKAFLQKHFVAQALEQDPNLLGKLDLLRQIQFINKDQVNHLSQIYYSKILNGKYAHYVFNAQQLEYQQKLINNTNFNVAESSVVKNLLGKDLKLNFEQILELVSNAKFSGTDQVWEKLKDSIYKLPKTIYIFNVKPLSSKYLLGLKALSEVLDLEILYFNQIPSTHLWSSNHKINRFYTLNNQLNHYAILQHNHSSDSSSSSELEAKAELDFEQAMVEAKEENGVEANSTYATNSNSYNAISNAKDNSNVSSNVGSNVNSNENRISNINDLNNPYANDNLLTEYGQYQLKAVKLIQQLEQNNGLETVTIFLDGYKLEQFTHDFNLNQTYYRKLTDLFTQEQQKLLVNHQSPSQILQNLVANPEFMTILSQIKPLPSLLTQVQQSIYEYANLPQDYSLYLSKTDDSIQVINAISPIREVEIAYDFILQALQQDPTLKLSDIVVAAPDIVIYEDYIKQVFDRYKPLASTATSTSKSTSNNKANQNSSSKLASKFELAQNEQADARYLPYAIATLSKESELRDFILNILNLPKDQLSLYILEQWLNYEPISYFYGLNPKHLDTLKLILREHPTSTAYQTTQLDDTVTTEYTNSDSLIGDYKATNDYNSWQHILLRAGLSNSFNYDNHQAILQTQDLDCIKNSNQTDVLAKFSILIQDLESYSKFVNQPHSYIYWLNFLKYIENTYFASSSANSTDNINSSSIEYLAENNSYYDQISSQHLLDNLELKATTSETNTDTSVTTDTDREQVYLDLLQKLNQVNTMTNNSLFADQYQQFNEINQLLYESAMHDNVLDLVVETPIIADQITNKIVAIQSKVAKSNIEYLNFLSLHDVDSSYFKVIVVLNMGLGNFPGLEQKNELDVSGLLNQPTYLPTNYEQQINSLLNIILNTKEKILFTYNNDYHYEPVAPCKPLQSLIDFLDRNCSTASITPASSSSSPIEEQANYTPFSAQNLIFANSYVFSEHNFTLKLAKQLEQKLGKNSYQFLSDLITTTNASQQDNSLLTNLLANQQLSMFNEWIYQPIFKPTTNALNPVNVDSNIDTNVDSKLDSNIDNGINHSSNIGNSNNTTTSLDLTANNLKYQYLDPNLFNNYFVLYGCYFATLGTMDTNPSEDFTCNELDIKDNDSLLSLVNQTTVLKSPDSQIIKLKANNLKGFFSNPSSSYLNKIGINSDYNTKYEKESFRGLTNNSDLKQLLKRFIKDPVNSISHLLQISHQNGIITPSIYNSSSYGAKEICQYLDQVVSQNIPIRGFSNDQLDDELSSNELDPHNIYLDGLVEFYKQSSLSDLSDAEVQQLLTDYKQNLDLSSDQNYYFPDKSCFSQLTTTIYFQLNDEFLERLISNLEQTGHSEVLNLDIDLIRNALTKQLEAQQKLDQDYDQSAYLDTEYNEDPNDDIVSDPALTVKPTFYSLPVSYNVYKDPQTQQLALYLIKQTNLTDSKVNINDVAKQLEASELLQLLAMSLAYNSPQQVVTQGKFAHLLPKTNHGQNSNGVMFPPILIHEIIRNSSNNKYNSSKKKDFLKNWPYLLESGVELVQFYLKGDYLNAGKTPRETEAVVEFTPKNISLDDDKNKFTCNLKSMFLADNELFLGNFEHAISDLVSRYLIGKDCLMPFNYQLEMKNNFFASKMEEFGIDTESFQAKDLVNAISIFSLSNQVRRTLNKLIPKTSTAKPKATAKTKTTKAKAKAKA